MKKITVITVDVAESVSAVTWTLNVMKLILLALNKHMQSGEGNILFYFFCYLNGYNSNRGHLADK